MTVERTVPVSFDSIVSRTNFKSGEVWVSNELSLVNATETAVLGVPYAPLTLHFTPLVNRFTFEVFLALAGVGIAGVGIAGVALVGVSRWFVGD